MSPRYRTAPERPHLSAEHGCYPVGFCPNERTDPGRAVNDRPLYRLPWSAVFPYAIASPPIGAAMGALELFIENNRERVSVAGGRTVSASPGLHLRLAESLTEVEAARTRLAMTWQDFHARVTRGEEIPYVLRTRCRYDAAHALAHCVGAVYRLLEVNGGRTMNADEAFQRFFRDLLAMRNHIAATLEARAGDCGDELDQAWTAAAAVVPHALDEVGDDLIAATGDGHKGLGQIALATAPRAFHAEIPARKRA
jgi:Acyl-CoA dehydrogenase, C-terminal domain